LTGAGPLHPALAAASTTSNAPHPAMLS
jgi:hypothetical protein